MLKRTIFTLLFVALGLGCWAQLVQDLHTIYEPVFHGQEETDTTVVVTPFGVIKQGVSYSLSLGGGYSALGKGVGVSNTYISPSISYSPNQKVQVIGGLTLSRNGYNGISFKDAVIPQETSMSQTPVQVWAYAQYNFNHKLSVYALGSVEQNQSYFSPYSNGIGMYDSKMLGLGLNYRISEKTSVGLRFNFENSNSPFYGYSRGSGFGNPFYY